MCLRPLLNIFRSGGFGWTYVPTEPTEIWQIWVDLCPDGSDGDLADMGGLMFVRI